MGEGGTVADPPVAKPADPPISETLPPTQNPDPTPKPEIIKEEEDTKAKPSTVGGDGSQSQSKKRKLGSVDDLRNSSYFKIRSIIRDLRPLFIEVIHAPDFRESKAAHDIRTQMKTMLELTKQLRNEAAKPMKSEEQPLPGASKEQKCAERENHVPQSQNGEIPSSSDKARENAPTCKDKNPVATEENIPEAKESAQQLEEGSQGTFVIGGSPVGWNFLVYPGSNLIYYGVTRESFRSSQATAK